MNKVVPTHIQFKRSSGNSTDTEKRRFSKSRGTSKSPFRVSAPPKYSLTPFQAPESSISSVTAKLTDFIQRHERETIIVIGSGDLGRGLVACLVRGGYRAVVASRNPQKARQRVESVGGEVKDYSTALLESDIVLLAIPYEGYFDLDAIYFNEKILVDVSNRPPNFDRNGPSMAEQLQQVVPGASVVKALNTLSAYALQRGLVQGSKQVPVCSDNEMAKIRVMELVRKLGFTPLDHGALSNAKHIEDIPLEFFPEWKTAGLVAFLIFVFIWVIVFFRKQLCPNIDRKADEEWKWDLFHAFPLKTSGNSAAITSFNLLASCYFPGVIAAYIQLFRGTKYSEFPSWLDHWMKARKQLGLFALFLAISHLMFALFLKISYGMLVHWKTQTYIVFGGISLILMGILGITSLPSVSSTLTWKEFFFVQSYLGWVSLVAAFVHTVLAELDHIFSIDFKCTLIADQVQIGLILPSLTILLKIPLIIPCVSSYLIKVRRGYERNSEKYTHNPSKVISLRS